MTVNQLSSLDILRHQNTKLAKHFDLSNAKRTSSDALRPIFPKMFYRAQTITVMELSTVTAYGFWLSFIPIYNLEWTEKSNYANPSKLSWLKKQ